MAKLAEYISFDIRASLKQIGRQVDAAKREAAEAEEQRRIRQMTEGFPKDECHLALCDCKGDVGQALPLMRIRHKGELTQHLPDPDAVHHTQSARVIARHIANGRGY